MFEYYEMYVWDSGKMDITNKESMSYNFNWSS